MRPPLFGVGIFWAERLYHGPDGHFNAFALGGFGHAPKRNLLDDREIICLDDPFPYKRIFDALYHDIRDIELAVCKPMGRINDRDRPFDGLKLMFLDGGPCRGDMVVFKPLVRPPVGRGDRVPRVDFAWNKERNGLHTLHWLAIASAMPWNVRERNIIRSCFGSFHASAYHLAMRLPLL